MALREKLEVIVDANVGGFVQGMDRAAAAADKGLGKTDDRLQVMAGRFTTWGAAAAGAGAVAAVGLGKLAMMAADAERQQLKLTNSIANSSAKFNANGQALREQASALQQVTAAEDDAIVGAQAMLVQFGLTEEQVKSMTPLVVDLSRKMGIDLDAAAKAVGRSATGSTTALKRMGIDVVALGEGATDAERTVSALTKSVGGFAEAEGKTFAGQLQIIKNQLGELGEQVGGGVLDVVKPFADLGGGLAEVNPELARTAGQIAAVGTAGITAGGGILFLSGQVLKAKDAMPGLATAISTLGVGPTAAIAALGVGIGVIATKALESKLNVEELQQAIFQFQGTGNIKELEESFSNLKDDLSNDISATEGFLGTLTGWIKPTRDGLNDAKKSFENLLDLARENPASGQALLEAIQQTPDILNDKSFQALGGVDALNKAINEGQQIAQGAAIASEKNAAAIGQTGEEADGAAQSLRDYASALKAQTDPYFAVIDAGGKLQDSLNKVVEAQAAVNETASPENVQALAAAQRDAAQSGLNLQAVAATLAAEVQSGNTSYEQASARLDVLAAQYPALAGAVEQVKAEFKLAAGAAEAMPERVRTEVEANVQQAIANINRAKDTALAATRNPYTLQIQTQVSGLSSILNTINQIQSATASAVGRINLAQINNPGGRDGDPATPYAMGGFLPGQATIAQGKGRGLIQWAEGETGGEAFIPLAPTKRKRSKDLWWETGRRLGVIQMAQGGFTADTLWGAIVEAQQNRSQFLFETASPAEQWNDLNRRLAQLHQFSDGWMDVQRQILRMQQETAADALAAAQERAENEWEWTYKRSTIDNQLLLAAQRRDSFGQFSDQWVRWAEEVERLQADIAEQRTPSAVASGGRVRAGSSGGSFHLTVNVNAQGLVTDPREVGRQVVGAIKAYEDANTASWRS